MNIFSLLPEWFQAYGIILELFFAIITFLISGLAFRVYRLTNDKRTELFGFAFLFMSLSYFMESLFNILINLGLEDFLVFNFFTLNKLFILSVYSRIILMTLGLSILAYMTLKIKNARALILIILTTTPLLLFADEPLQNYFIISVVYLIFISAYYVSNYIDNKNTKTTLIAIAFTFLLFSKIVYVFSISNILFYVAGTLIEVVSYSLILLNFALVLKK